MLVFLVLLSFAISTGSLIALGLVWPLAVLLGAVLTALGWVVIAVPDWDLSG